MDIRKSAAALAAVVLCLFALMPAASADIHRCSGPDGKLFFSDGACPMASNAKREQAPDVGRPLATPAGSPPVKQAELPAPADLPPPPAQVAPPVILPSGPAGTTSMLAKLPSTAQLEQRSGMHGGALVFGLLVWFVATIWFLVIAFTDSVVWGLLVLFVPFTGFVFMVMHWSKTWRPVLASVAGVLIMAFSAGSAGPQAQVMQSVLVPCTDTGAPIGNPGTSFSSNDFICLNSDLMWTGSRLKGAQLVTWKWYKGAGVTPADTVPRSVDFTAPPQAVSGVEPAFSLGPGLHKVELYLNGRLLETQQFEVH